MVVMPPTCLPRQGTSVEGMSEHNRNFPFILSFRESQQGRSGCKKGDAAQARWWSKGQGRVLFSSNLGQSPTQLIIVSRGINCQEWNMLVGSVLIFGPFKLLTTWIIPWAVESYTEFAKDKRIKTNKQLSSVKWKMRFPSRMSYALHRKHFWAKALGPLVLVWFLGGKMGRLVL